MAILQDLRLLADAREISYASIVPLLSSFADSESTVVNALYTVANKLKKFVKPNSAEEKALQAFYDKLSAKQVARLGWTAKAGESYDDVLTRPYVLNVLVLIIRLRLPRHTIYSLLIKIT